MLYQANMFPSHLYPENRNKNFVGKGWWCANTTSNPENNWICQVFQCHWHETNPCHHFSFSWFWYLTMSHLVKGSKGWTVSSCLLTDCSKFANSLMKTKRDVARSMDSISIINFEVVDISGKLLLSSCSFSLSNCSCRLFRVRKLMGANL